MWITHLRRGVPAFTWTGWRNGSLGDQPRRRRPLARDRAGVTSIEYALMGGLIAVVIIGAVSAYTGGLGSMMSGSFATIAAAM